MAKGEIVIDEGLCTGCGLCAEFCKLGCIELSGKLTSAGVAQARFAYPEKCTACAVCGWLCPDFAIEVYKYVEVAPG